MPMMIERVRFTAGPDEGAFRRALTAEVGRQYALEVAIAMGGTPKHGRAPRAWAVTPWREMPWWRRLGVRFAK